MISMRLSLAWAAAEKLAKLNAWTLFATHYFELTVLPETLSTVANVHLNATEHNERIVFLHHVLPGPASQSYGLAVAQLAGVPSDVMACAKAHLTRLEQTSLNAPTVKTNSAPVQNDLFASLPHPAVDALSAINPDNLTPRQALELLYQLKEQL